MAGVERGLGSAHSPRVGSVFDAPQQSCYTARLREIPTIHTPPFVRCSFSQPSPVDRFQIRIRVCQLDLRAAFMANARTRLNREMHRCLSTSQSVVPLLNSRTASLSIPGRVSEGQTKSIRQGVSHVGAWECFAMFTERLLHADNKNPSRLAIQCAR